MNSSWLRFSARAARLAAARNWRRSAVTLGGFWFLALLSCHDSYPPHNDWDFRQRFVRTAVI